MIQTAVVILNWNGKNFFEKFLPILVRHTSAPDVALYIADNGSEDESVRFIKKNFPQINLLLLDKNYGFCEGYNKALIQIEAKYFVLLNSDVEVTENWIQPIVDRMERDPLIAACMPKIKSLAQKDYFEYAGAAGGFIDKYGFPFCRGRILNVIEKDEGQYNEATEIFWASGVCMFLRADLYQSAGGFDPDFYAHMEEIDLCWRLKNRGYKIMCYPDVTIYHVGGGSLPNESPHKLFLNFRNNLLLLFKNLPEEKWRSTLFKRKLFDGLAALKYLMTFSFREFYIVLKVHRAFHKMKNKFLHKRKDLLKTVINSNHSQIYSKSIIIGFFLRKKNKFTDLK